MHQVAERGGSSRLLLRMAINWGLMYLMFTYVEQKADLPTEISRSFLYNGIVRNISTFPASPNISVENYNSSAYPETRKAENITKDLNYKAIKSNRLLLPKRGQWMLRTASRNISQSDSPETLFPDSSTSCLSLLSFESLTSMNQTKKRAVQETTSKEDDIIWNFSAPPADPLTETVSEEPLASSSRLSCGGRCGDWSSFPCSCNDICIVHGNCCHDISDKCQHLTATAKSRFERLKGVEIECSSMTSTFMVMSCSDHSDSGASAIRLVHDDTPGRSGSARCTSCFTSKTPQTNNTINNTLDTVVSHFTDQPGMNKKIHDEIPTSTSDILSLIMNAPIMDFTSGIVYRSRSIAQCNGVLDSYILPWKVRLPVISYSLELKNIEALGELVTTKDIAYVEPHLPKNISKGSQCVINSIKHCRREWIKDNPELETLCLTGNVVYYITRKPLKKEYFDNMHCVLCYVGSDNHTLPVESYIPWQKVVKLSVVLSLSSSGTLTLLKQKKTDMLNWDALTCSVNTGKGGSGQCRTTKCTEGFEKRSDGVCRTLKKRQFAIGRDNCEFKRSQEFEKKLLSLIKCHLEATGNAELITETSRFVNVYDTRLGIPLVKLETDVYFPYDQPSDRQYQIRRELALLVYDANFCCVPLETDAVCSGASCRIGELEIQTVRSADAYEGRPNDKPNEGHGLVENSSVIFCESKGRGVMRCQQEHIYASQFHFFRWTANISCFGSNVGTQTLQSKERQACSNTPSPTLNLGWIFALWGGLLVLSEVRF